MNCSSCHSQLRTEAAFCEECGAPVHRPEDAHAAYGSVDERPQSAVRFGALVAVLLGAAAVAAVTWYQYHQQRSRDALDFAELDAELALLEAPVEQLESLSVLAAPTTPPADYAARLQACHRAHEQYVRASKRASRLASSRPYPNQFERAAAMLGDAVAKYALVLPYLEKRSKIRPPTPGSTAHTDQDIANLAQMGRKSLDSLRQLLESMRRQSAERDWDYDVAPAGQRAPAN
jgi:hypothetical protein